MKHLIDKDALVAEIEKCYNECLKRAKITDSDYWNAKADAYRNVLVILDGTLEVKEENFIWKNARTTVPEDSTNQIICIKEDGLAVSTVGKIVNRTIKWAYLDDLLNTNSFNVEAKEVDLEKEIQDHVRNCLDVKFPTTDIGQIKKDVEYTARMFFELGLKAQKGE